MSRACSTCGSSDIDFDPSRGDTFCTNCGSVLEEGAIVTEVGFQETSAGGTSVIGQFVSSEGNKVGQGFGFRQGYGRESRAITLENGKKRLAALANQLQLNNHCVESAYMFLKLAVSKRLTKGRRTGHVAAACLYLVCRTEKTPHLLIDFSDVLQVDVMTLGKVYLKLQHELCINLPVLDPCLYIHRFCHKFQLGEKENEVANTALRLVSRMKRDWIQYGRRPSGLCGAAILVSARLHGFSRTIKEVVKVVRLSNTTIRKRLGDFKKTPSGQLTIDEFNTIDLEEEQDPPCFTEGRLKQKQQQLGELNDNEKQNLDGELEDLRRQIDERLNKTKSQRDTSKTYGSQCADSDVLSECSADVNEERWDPSQQSTDNLLTSEASRSVDASCAEDMKSDNGLTAGVSEDISNEIGDVDDFGIQGSTSGSCLIANCSSSELLNKTNDVEIGEDLSGSHNIGEKNSYDDTANGDILKLRQEDDSAVRMVSNFMNDSLLESSLRKDDDKEEVVEEKLDDLDEDELDNFILTKTEVEVKTKIWMEENKEYLEMIKEKQEREAEEREREEADPNKKKRRKPYKRKTKEKANSVGEAVEKMLIEKKISNKINYDVLRNLNKDTELEKPSACEEPERTNFAPVANLIQAVKPIIPVRYTGRKRDRSVLPILPTKKMKYIDSITDRNAIESPKVDSSLVVENGPVNYEDQECDHDEVDNEGDSHLSAVQLMGQEYGQDEADGYDDFDHY